MENKMKIGVNVDGVLIDTSSFILKYGQKFLGNNNKFINPLASKFTEMFCCSKKESDEFWKKYFHKYCLRANPEKDAADVLKKLKDNGNEIYIVASRSNITDKGFIGDINRSMLKFWLNKNEIPFDGIVYCNKHNKDDKYNACKNLGIDIMIEDKVTDALNLREVSKVVILSRPYNFGLNNSEIYRASNFKNIYDYIENDKRKIR